MCPMFFEKLQNFFMNYSTCIMLQIYIMKPEIDVDGLLQPYTMDSYDEFFWFGRMTSISASVKCKMVDQRGQ